MRVNKDGTGNMTIGPPSFRELADIRLHKYGYGMPGLSLASFSFSVGLYFSIFCRGG